ncbi:MAG: anaerobic ribonucleoside-triphosphate reductase [Victivallis sp.]
MRKEAPYHALTNAGHISYVELDGDTAKNVDAFESVVRCMHDAGIGYGSINHPVDRDPVCGYNGIIGETCPKCHRHAEPGGAEVEADPPDHRLSGRNAEKPWSRQRESRRGGALSASSAEHEGFN